MKLQIFLLLLICSYFTACTNKDKKKGAENKAVDSPVAAIPSAAGQFSQSDTVIIDETAAVFYAPDSARLDSLFRANGETEMWTGVGDYLYYLNESAEYLKPYLPIKEVSSRNILQFVATDKKVTFLQLDTLTEYWGVLLFDPAKAPRQVDITAIEEDYKAYFQ